MTQSRNVWLHPHMNFIDVDYDRMEWMGFTLAVLKFRVL